MLGAETPAALDAAIACAVKAGCTDAYRALKQFREANVVTPELLGYIAGLTHLGLAAPWIFGSPKEPFRGSPDSFREFLRAITALSNAIWRDERAGKLRVVRPEGT